MYVTVYYDRYGELSLKAKQRQIHAKDISYMEVRQQSNGIPWTYMFVKRAGDSYECYAPHPPAMVSRALAVLQAGREAPSSASFPLTNGEPEPELLSRTLDLTDPRQMVLTELSRDPQDPNVILTEERVLIFRPKPAAQSLRPPALT